MIYEFPWKLAISIFEVFCLEVRKEYFYFCNNTLHTVECSLIILSVKSEFRPRRVASDIWGASIQTKHSAIHLKRTKSARAGHTRQLNVLRPTICCFSVINSFWYRRLTIFYSSSCHRRLSTMSRCRCRDAINNYRVAQLWTISRDFFKSNFFLMPSLFKDFKLLSIVLIKYQQSNLPCLLIIKLRRNV